MAKSWQKKIILVHSESHKFSQKMIFKMCHYHCFIEKQKYRSKWFSSHGAPTTIFPGALVANTLSTCRHTAYYRIEIFGDCLVHLTLGPPLVHDGVFYSGGSSFPLSAAYASGRRHCGCMQVARWIKAVPRYRHLSVHLNSMPVVGSNRVWTVCRIKGWLSPPPFRTSEYGYLNGRKAGSAII